MAIRVLAGLSLFALVMNSGGCATIISGTHQEVPVTTVPKGATVQVDGDATYTTPVTIELKRKDNHELLISHPGYHSVRVPVVKKLNNAVFGNLLAGGLVGGVVDASSGASNNLKPDRIDLTLKAVREGETLQVFEWSAAEVREDQEPADADEPDQPDAAH